MTARYDPQSRAKQEVAYTLADLPDAPYLYLLQGPQSGEFERPPTATRPPAEEGGGIPQGPTASYTPSPKAEPQLRPDPSTYYYDPGPRLIDRETRGVDPDVPEPGILSKTDDPEFEEFMEQVFGFLQDPTVVAMATPISGLFGMASQLFGNYSLPNPPTGLLGLADLARNLYSATLGANVQQSLNPVDIGGFDAGDIFGGYEGQSQLGYSIGDDVFGGGGGGGFDSGADIQGGFGGGAGDFGGGYGGGSDTFGGGSNSGDAGSGGGGGQSDAGGGGGGVCFAAGTAILMDDGNLKTIETIKLGDKVMAFDGEGELEPREVVALLAKRSQPVVRVNVKTLVTQQHRFFVNQGAGWEFVAVEDILAGAIAMGPDGSEIVIDGIEDAREQRDVYNLTVEGLHTYVANGFRVHNIKHEGGYIPESTVPGKPRSDVPEILQEGEYVMTADAVDMLGPDFFGRLNDMAKLAKR